MRSFSLPAVVCGLLQAQTTVLSWPQSISVSWGYSIHAAGDLDGDGVMDIAVGGPFNRAGASFVDVRSGRTGRTLQSVQGSLSLGYSVAGSVDFDLDGIPDLLVGNPLSSVGARETGSVQVISGRTWSTVYQKTGAADDRLGKRVAWVGDVDGDGIPDFAALAHHEYPAPQPGYVAVWSGRDGSEILRLTTPFASGPYAFAGVGDINRDGRADIAVGLGQPAPPNIHLAPVVVFSGASGAVLRVLLGDSNHSSVFGWSISAAGDIDRDGVVDLVIGDPNDSLRAPHGGRVWLFSGATGAPIWSIAGATDDALGTSVCAIADVDRDGVPDVVVGAPHPFLNNPPGYVEVLSGATGAVLRHWDGLLPGDQFGFAVAASDISGDGRPDVLVGAPCPNNHPPATYSYVSVFSTVNATRVGAGCGAVPLPDLDGVEPRLGQPWALQGSAPPGAAGLLFLGLRPDLPTPLSSSCTAYLPLSRLFPLAPLAANAAGVWSLALPVPYDTVLENVDLAVQACLVDPTQPPAPLLTNGLYAGVRR